MPAHFTLPVDALGSAIAGAVNTKLATAVASHAPVTFLFIQDIQSG
jgi:hypothetical protein